MDAALSRGWTSISEQWVNPERLDELETLAADDALPLRVDAYLALNFGTTNSSGTGTRSREPGAVATASASRGSRSTSTMARAQSCIWDPADLTATIGRADEAGWQVSVHAMSSAAQDLVLDAFEAAHRPDRAESAPSPDRARRPGDRRAAGPHGRHGHRHGDPPRRRCRLADCTMTFLPQFDRDNPGDEIGWLARWRDFVTRGCMSPRQPMRRGPSRTSSQRRRLTDARPARRPDRRRDGREASHRARRRRRGCSTSC